MILNNKEFQVGDVYEECIVDGLTRSQIVQYSGASGDFNPVHTDEIFATQVMGLPSVFAHGMLTMAMTGKMITNYVGDGRLKKFGVRFTKQVFPGNTLNAKATIKEIYHQDENILVDLDILTKNQDNQTVLSGYATAFFQKAEIWHFSTPVISI